MVNRSLSVIVPVFDEEHEIEGIVAAVRETLQSRGADWEILVVDNASTDATCARLEAHLGPQIRLIRNEVNRGKGYSVRRGMLEARCELRLMCDADCAPSLASLPQMEALMASADVVAGVRNAPDSDVGRYQPLRRRLASKAFIALCRLVMSEPLTDIFCGFKLFGGAAAENIFALSRIDGWAFDAEALALARELGYSVEGCGIAWVNRPASRLSMPRVVVPVLRELIATRAHLRAERASGRLKRIVPDAG